jgi:DNA-binding LacI/PurR family transcriptional regulator
LNARRRATSYDVAKAAGVAQSTVSRCFQDDSGISPATRARVHQVAAELGYTPNALARSLIKSRSNMVGLMVSELTLRANPDLVAGLGRALAQAGKRVMLMACADTAAAEAAARSALEYPLDGLIVTPMIADASLAPFLRQQVPIVALNRPPAPAGADRVASDHAEAGREVATRLHRAGHRRFVCLGGAASFPVNEERRRGFLGRLAELGVADSHELLVAETYADARAAFAGHVARHGAPHAVFCVYDQLAFGVIDACRFDLGLAVPTDISVIGFDDVAEAAHQAYDLTSMRQNLAAIAEATVRLLLARLDTPDAASETVLIPVTLSQRGSARL